MSCQNIYTSSYIDNATGSRGYWSDRDVNDTLQLPHSFHDIKVKPNELVTYHVINNSISKLYDNLLYLVSKARTPQSTIPSKSGFTSFISTDQPAISGLQHIREYSASYLSDPIQSYSFETSQMKNQSAGVFFDNDDVEDVYSNRGVVYVSNGHTTNICMLQDTVSGFILKDVTDRVDNYTNRKFPAHGPRKTITCGDMMYTAVDGDEIIYKHDVSGLRRDDQSYFDPDTTIGGKILLDIIGAPGGLDDSARFKSITTITGDDSHNLYVVDTDDQIMVKKFDKNSNYITSHNITQHVQNEQIQDMCFTNNKFLLLTISSVIEFTSTFTFLKSTKLTDQLLPGENYKHIASSDENRNVVYVASNKRVFKKFITRLESGIGVFQFAGRAMPLDDDTMDISFISVARSSDGDAVYVGDNSRGVVFQFNESIDYQQVISDGYQKSFLPVQSMLLKPEEYVNYIVYNKMIAKLFYNHASVGNCVIKRFMCKSSYGNFLQFDSLRYLLPKNIRSRNRIPSLKNFIGSNEIVMSAVINRTLKYIYLLQQDLMDDLNVDVVDITRNAVTIDTAAPPVSAAWSFVDGSWTDQPQDE